MDRLLAMAKFETFAQYEAEVFAIQASADLKWFHATLELLRAESPENRRTAIDVLGQSAQLTRNAAVLFPNICWFPSVTRSSGQYRLEPEVLSPQCCSMCGTTFDSLVQSPPEVLAEVMRELASSLPLLTYDAQNGRQLRSLRPAGGPSLTVQRGDGGSEFDRGTWVRVRAKASKVVFSPARSRVNGL